jgi:ribosomal protein L34
VAVADSGGQVLADRRQPGRRSGSEPCA